MAKVTITIQDGGDMVEVSTSFTPELSPDLNSQDLDTLTPAQMFALQLLGSLDNNDLLEEQTDEFAPEA